VHRFAVPDRKAAAIVEDEPMRVEMRRKIVSQIRKLAPNPYALELLVPLVDE
jgi:hypothetical protein